MASAGAWSRPSRLGVNEFLRKPVSAKALLDRIVAILAKPRPMVQLGDYYGPEPRKLFDEPMQKIDRAADRAGRSLNGLRRLADSRRRRRPTRLMI